MIIRALFEGEPSDKSGGWCEESKTSVPAGMPQGSVLPPLLFLVFVKELVMKLSERVEVSAFADDLAIWKAS